MSKRLSILASVILISMGLLAMACNLAALVPGLNGWRWGPWRLWPLVVVGSGLFFVVPPLLVRGKRGLGGLFIPGMPILATGSILLFCSVFDAWQAWAWLWPLEVLSVAAGFLWAAIYMRVIWLVIPAAIIGANGLLLQFCAITGWWGVWAVLWTIEPLAVGLAFLVISAFRRSAGLLMAGLILCGIAGIGFAGMTGILSLAAVASIVPVSWLSWPFKILGPVAVIVAGVVLLVVGLARRPSAPEPVAE